jgi:hypothetical protein
MPIRHRQVMAALLCFPKAAVLARQIFPAHPAEVIRDKSIGFYKLLLLLSLFNGTHLAADRPGAAAILAPPSRRARVGDQSWVSSMH